MVKKLRFQKIRTGRRRHAAPGGAWVFEPQDGALIAAAVLLMAWLQWVSHTS